MATHGKERVCKPLHACRSTPCAPPSTTWTTRPPHSTSQPASSPTPPSPPRTSRRSSLTVKVRGGGAWAAAGSPRPDRPSWPRQSSPCPSLCPPTRWDGSSTLVPCRFARPWQPAWNPSATRCPSNGPTTSSSTGRAKSAGSSPSSPRPRPLSRLRSSSATASTSPKRRGLFPLRRPRPCWPKEMYRQELTPQPSPTRSSQ